INNVSTCSCNGSTRDVQRTALDLNTGMTGDRATADIDGSRLWQVDSSVITTDCATVDIDDCSSTLWQSIARNSEILCINNAIIDSQRRPCTSGVNTPI